MPLIDITQIYAIQDRAGELIGALNPEKTQFYPFYRRAEPDETNDAVFGYAEEIELDDADDATPESIPYTEIYAEFCARRADYPGAVTNEEWFQDCIRFAAFRESKSCVIGELTARIDKLTATNLHVTITTPHIAVTCQYVFNDPSVRPILPKFRAYALTPAPIDY